MTKINKNSKINKLRDKFDKDRKKYREYLLAELNYDPPPKLPAWDIINIRNKKGEMSYSCPQLLPEYDKLYIKIGDKIIL